MPISDTPNKLSTRYQIRGPIGKGGAGEVFVAWDSQLERTVAIKRLKTEDVGQEAIDGTWREAMRLAAVRHPNIVAVYDIGLDEGSPYIVMEYIQGETIEQRTERGVMTLSEFGSFATQTMEGLIAAHHAGLVHRDLKPSNLMLSRLPSGSFQVKVLDFGIAKFLNAPTKQTMNADGTITGSIQCISPEQLSQAPVDHRSDLYAAGCVFYQVLAGHYPFGGKRITEIIAAHLNHQVIHLKEYRPDLPPLLCEWVMAMISLRAEDRYQHGRDALVALRAVIDAPKTGPIAVSTDSSAEASVSGAKSSPAGRFPWAAALLSLVGIGGIGAYFFAPGGALNRWPSATPVAVAAPVTPLSVPAKPSEVKVIEPVLAKETQPAAEALPKPAESLPAKDPVAAPAPAPKAPASVVLRFAGSNTVGAGLLPALAEAFFKREGGTQIERKPGANHEEVSIEATFEGANPRRSIEISAHGSATAFSELAASSCDIGMASRAIKPDEAQACARAGLGDMQSALCEHVLGLDGIAILVHKRNPVSELSKPQIADIFSGRISDWSQVGGSPGAIKLYARDNKSGTFDTFKSLVLGASDLAAGAERMEDSEALSDAVATNPNAIGFVGLPYVRSAKLLAVSEPGAAPFLATRFTVATEDYVLSRRLFLYVPDNPQNILVSRFVDFALSEEGQEIVHKIGFVKQSIDLQRPVQPANASRDYLDATARAERLSLNFRFRAGQAELDNKALRDVSRLTALLNDPRTRDRKLVLLGFADAKGAAATNLKLSRDRAKIVAQYLTSRGLTPALVAGVGSELPVASNDTEQGRDRNRRVEVWLKEAGAN